MQIFVMSCSPKKETSLTYNSCRFLEKMFPDDKFTFQYTTDPTFPDESIDDFKNADLVLVISSIFHFSVHSSTYAMFVDMKTKLGDALKGKPMTFFSTSGKNGEYNAHDLVRRFAESAGAYWIPSLSTKDVGMLSPEGREEAFCWFNFVKGCMKGETTLKDKANVVVLDTYGDPAEDKDGLVEKARSTYEAAGANVKVITLRERDIKPCIACGSCYSTRECLLKDEYENTVNEYYLNTDVITIVGKVDLGTLGVLYKGFVERGMQFGRAGEIHGVIMSYICSGEEEPNFAEDLAYFRKHQSCVDSLSHEFVVGYFRASQADIALKQTISAYNADVMPGESGLAIGLDMQFAYLASFIRELEPADYIDYQKRGFYDPVKPEPHARTILSPADAAASRKGRVVPFNMALLDFDGKVKITERRPLKPFPITERKKKDAQAALNGNTKPEKKGFFGWKK